ncbi:MAG: hypothetical protein QOK37_2780 [Thermoanaerobaculia bacterium]|jgi:hypothetical protein|nr:hypothetical protein [Thermoanaerobaculia bacterium]
MQGIDRPEAEVLEEDSLVPGRNYIRPAPTHFTHRVDQKEPFAYAGSTTDSTPDGNLPAGTEVLLVREDPDGYSWVIDGRGLYVRVRTSALRAR